MAGGLKEEAGPSLFLIRRTSEEDASSEREKKESAEKTSETYVISLDELLVKGDFRLNQPLNHGDVINIPVSGKIFVGGQVIRPGGFPMKGKRITVSQAVALAEGLKPDAAFPRQNAASRGWEGAGISVGRCYAIQKRERRSLPEGTTS
jgi:protein involved in polysaccharide export with SLBB domain